MEKARQRPNLEEPLPVPTSTQSTSTLGEGTGPRMSLYDYLFRTQNAILQTILASILYGGFGVFFLWGFQWVPEDSIHRQLSIATVAFSMVAFVFATMSEPKWVISPIHKDHIPPELKSATPNTKFSPEIYQAVKERFGETWCDRVGVYPYDNTIFFPHQWCKECAQPRPARSQHCSLCGHCVSRADHHCWWLNTHVGEGNYHIFLGMLFVMAWLVTYGTYIMHGVINAISLHYNLHELVPQWLTENGYNEWYSLPSVWYFVYKHQFIAKRNFLLWMIFALITTLSVPVVLFTCYHIRLALFNITTHEDTKRQYLEKWLERSKIDDQLDTKLVNLDRTMINLPTNRDRDEFWVKEEVGLIKDFWGEGGKKSNGNDDDKNNGNNNNSNDNKSSIPTTTIPDDDLVGCVPATSPTSLTISKPTKHLHSQDQPTGCFGGPSSGCDDGCGGEKKTDNTLPPSLRPALRSPFPLIFPASTQPEYQPTPDELYIKEMIERQGRPEGYRGWYEPDKSPLISPPSHRHDPTNSDPTSSTSIIPENQDQVKVSKTVSTMISQQFPPPSVWSREYFLHATSHNIYDLGSFWLNIKDAFGLIKKDEVPNGQFFEYDLDLLIRLRCDWESHRQQQQKEKNDDIVSGKDLVAKKVD